MFVSLAKVCPLEFTSWIYDGSLLDLDHYDHKGVIDATPHITIPEWSPKEVPVKKRVRHFLCCEEPFVVLIFSLKIQRQPQFFVIKCILPFIIISSLSCFIFCLPPDNGERVSLGINTMLAFAVMSTMVADAMPSSSDIVPKISSYFFTIFVLDVASLVVNIWIINIQAKSYPVPRWVRVFVLKCCAVLVCLRHKNETPTASEMYKLPDANVSAEEMHGHVKNKVEDGDENTEFVEDMEPTDTRSILNEVKHITNKIHITQTTDKIREEWRSVARVLDRLAIVMFVIAMTTATLIMFIQALYVSREE